MHLKSGKMQSKVQKVQTKCKTDKRCNSLKMKDIYSESAKVQKVQEKKVLCTMIELDKINDNIPIDTPYVLDNITVPCLKKHINNIIIEYTKDHLSGDNILGIKKTYEELTGKETDIVINTPIEELYILLDELIDKIPMNIPGMYMGKYIVCFNTIIREVKIGLKTYPRDRSFIDSIREIYTILHLNGYNQFEGKY